MLHEYIFEKVDGFYTRILLLNKEDARETEKKMGWKLIAGNLHISESIEFCEQHNMPILEGMIKK